MTVEKLIKILASLNMPKGNVYPVRRGIVRSVPHAERHRHLRRRGECLNRTEGFILKIVKQLDFHDEEVPTKRCPWCGTEVREEEDCPQPSTYCDHAGEATVAIQMSEE